MVIVNGFQLLTIIGKRSILDVAAVLDQHECVTVTEDIFRTRTREIVESVLDENSVEVTTWDVAKTFIERSRCERFKILLKAGDNDIAHDVQLNVLSRGGPFCHQSHLLILCVVTLLFWISL